MCTYVCVCAVTYVQTVPLWTILRWLTLCSLHCSRTQVILLIRMCGSVFVCKYILLIFLHCSYTSTYVQCNIIFHAQVHMKFYCIDIQWNLSIKDTLGPLLYYSLLQRFPQSRGHFIHCSTSPTHRMVSILQRFSYIIHRFVIERSHCTIYVYTCIHTYTCKCTYVRMYVHTHAYVHTYVCMYPDAWAFSINYKSANRSTFAMYWGTFVMYPSFCK